MGWQERGRAGGSKTEVREVRKANRHVPTHIRTHLAGDVEVVDHDRGPTDGRVLNQAQDLQAKGARDT